MSIGVSVRATKLVTRNNGSVAQEGRSPQTQLQIVLNVLWLHKDDTSIE